MSIFAILVSVIRKNPQYLRANEEFPEWEHELEQMCERIGLSATATDTLIAEYGTFRLSQPDIAKYEQEFIDKLGHHLHDTAVIDTERMQQVASDVRKLIPGLIGTAARFLTARPLRPRMSKLSAADIEKLYSLFLAQS